MTEFTKNMKFILAFLFVTLLLSMFAGQKMTYSFLVLVLLGMILMNSDKFNKILGGLKNE